jgi:hypothetical protein
MIVIYDYIGNVELGHTLNWNFIFRNTSRQHKSKILLKITFCILEYIIIQNTNFYFLSFQLIIIIINDDVYVE